MIPLSALVAVLLTTTAAAVVTGNPEVTLPTFPQGFGADVTIEERHNDEQAVTDNPVEYGAPITDHAFMRPFRLSLKIGFSNSNPTLGNSLYVARVYELFQNIQQSGIPFGILTQKRIYSNMLITGLETFTDEKWANAMLLSVYLRQVIIVNTFTVSVPANQNMTAPQITGTPVNTGYPPLTNGTGYNAAATPNGIGIPYLNNPFP